MEKIMNLNINGADFITKSEQDFSFVLTFFLQILFLSPDLILE